MHEYGFNAFRIGAIWAALQPSPNVTDAVYLDALQNATRLLAKHGAYSILDMHQDALSNGTGWSSHDGAPSWVVNRTKPRHDYPWPVGNAGLELSGQRIASAPIVLRRVRVCASMSTVQARQERWRRGGGRGTSLSGHLQ